MKEISIEDYSVSEDTVYIAYYEHNDFKELRVPMELFEEWVKENDILNWHSFKQEMDGTWDEVEGHIAFQQFIEDNLTDEILEKFITSVLKKMKS